MSIQGFELPAADASPEDEAGALSDDALDFVVGGLARAVDLPSHLARAPQELPQIELRG